MDKQPRDEQEVRNDIKSLTRTESRHILQTVMLLLSSQWFVLDMLYNLFCLRLYASPKGCERFALMAKPINSLQKPNLMSWRTECRKSVCHWLSANLCYRSHVSQPNGKHHLYFSQLYGPKEKRHPWNASYLLFFVFRSWWLIILKELICWTYKVAVRSHYHRRQCHKNKNNNDNYPRSRLECEGWEQLIFNPIEPYTCPQT